MLMKFLKNSKDGKISAYRAVFAVMFLYSVLMILLSWKLGISDGDGFRGYLNLKESYNWYLYPLFWMIVIPFVKATWEEFLSSWKSLDGNEQFKTADGESGAKVSSSMMEEFAQHRKFILLPAAFYWLQS